MIPFFLRSILYVVCIASYNLTSNSQCCAKEQEQRKRLIEEILCSVTESCVCKDIAHSVSALGEKSPSFLLLEEEISFGNVIHHGTGGLLIFAAKSPDHAKATLSMQWQQITWRKGFPSVLQMLAGFAQIPCDVDGATKRLQEAYYKNGIPEQYQQPFEGADESGNWKKFDLPEHLKKLDLDLNQQKKSKCHCSIQ